MDTSDQTLSNKPSSGGQMKKQQNPGKGSEAQKNTGISKNRVKRHSGTKLDVPIELCQEAWSEKKPYERQKISEDARNLKRS